MKLTIREKEMLVMFGCENRKLMHQRLGLACICITDVLSKAAVNGLRNRISSISCDERYIKIYHNVKRSIGLFKQWWLCCMIRLLIYKLLFF